MARWQGSCTVTHQHAAGRLRPRLHITAYTDRLAYTLTTANQAVAHARERPRAARLPRKRWSPLYLAKACQPEGEMSGVDAGLGACGRREAGGGRQGAGPPQGCGAAGVCSGAHTAPLPCRLSSLRSAASGVSSGCGGCQASGSSGTRGHGTSGGRGPATATA